jgi:hypothetical protein
LADQVAEVADLSGQSQGMIIRRCVELDLWSPELRVLLHGGEQVVLVDLVAVDQRQGTEEYARSQQQVDFARMVEGMID